MIRAMSIAAAVALGSGGMALAPGIAADPLGAADRAGAGRALEGDAALWKGDYETALKLLMPLAQQGDAVAELDIGLMYFAGKGVPQDRAEAAKWFLASAKQGQLGAQVNIGIAYATGAGVRHDHVQAYMWFSLAAAQGVSGAAAYRDHVATEMTSDQIRSATENATLCKASNYQTCGSP